MKKENINKYAPGFFGIFLLVFVLVGLWLIFGYLGKERQRDLMAWQSHLASIAEMRVSNIESMLNRKKSDIQGLAENASLRLYLTEYASKESVNEIILNAQKSHIKNLLISSVIRLGISDLRDDNNKLNLNIRNEYGLVILDSKQKMIMSSNRFQGDIENHLETINRVYKTHKPHVIELEKTASQRIIYGYIVPVFGVQDITKNAPVGGVMTIMDPYKDLYDILQSKQDVTLTDESILVTKHGSGVNYVSPINKPFEIFHNMSDEKNLLAASYAINNPGLFAEKKDYMGNDVLVTGRKVKGSSWYLVQKISTNEAMFESDRHQEFLLIVFGLVLVSILISFVAIWKHSTNIRLQELKEDLQARTTLLNSITDNIKENIILLDESSRVIYINPVFENILSVKKDEIKGVPVENILGKISAEKLINTSVNKYPENSIILSNNEIDREYHVTKTCLEKGRYKKSNLYVLHDITDIRNEQRKGEKLSEGIINTLVRAVDLHDPHCANHSQRTCEVAYEIACEMGYKSDALETLKMASLLANIGKLFVSKDILIKHEKLSEEESKELKKHIEYGVKILQELSFNGPVVEIISQKNERLDGSGYPDGLKDEEILPEAKILAVANAFVAMTSARAYREGRKVDEVINMLVKQSESQYDRHVVAALFHIAENKANWKSWYSVEQS